jgi:hypothetical protein
VGTETKSICLQIDADARLAAAAGGVARYLGDSAGLENDANAQLQKAVVAACEEAFESLTKEHSHLDVTLSRHSDRIEVALAREGEAAPGSAPGGPPVISGFDRVQYETRGRVVVTRLTKYISQGAPSR